MAIRGSVIGLLAFGIACLLSSHAIAMLQAPPGICELLPGAETCNGGGSEQRGGKEADPGTFAWGAVEPLTRPCRTEPARPQYLQRLVWASGPSAGTYVTADDFGGGYGSGSRVPNGPAEVVFAADGYAYRWVCSSRDIDADVWAEATERMDDAAVTKNPVVSGLTGLETWAWFDGDPTVQPFQVTWTDPATGFTWTLEAWAWMRDMTWSFGDGEVHVESARGLDEALAVAGTVDNPAAVHTYRATSADAGFDDGYPFEFSATWVGQYRWSADGGGTWSAPVPMTGSYTDTAAIAYQVMQIRSALVTTDG